jgi:hypothetical protein
VRRQLDLLHRPRGCASKKAADGGAVAAATATARGKGGGWAQAQWERRAIRNGHQLALCLAWWIVRAEWSDGRPQRAAPACALGRKHTSTGPTGDRARSGLHQQRATTAPP